MPPRVWPLASCIFPSVRESNCLAIRGKLGRCAQESQQDGGIIHRLLSVARWVVLRGEVLVSAKIHVQEVLSDLPGTHLLQLHKLTRNHSASRVPTMKRATHRNYQELYLPREQSFLPKASQRGPRLIRGYIKVKFKTTKMKFKLQN